MNVSSFFEAVEKMSVKELDRIKKHIEDVIEIKKPEEKKFIGTLDIDNFVSFYPEFLSDEESLNISNDIEMYSGFGPITNCNTKSL